MDRAWLFHWKKAFIFIPIEGLLIAVGEKLTSGSTAYHCHANSCAPPARVKLVTRVSLAGVVVGHESHKAAGIARNYPECRRAPYSCKVRTKTLTHAMCLMSVESTCNDQSDASPQTSHVAVLLIYK